MTHQPVLYVQKSEYDGLKAERDMLLATLGYFREQLATAWTEQQVAAWIQANQSVLVAAFESGVDMLSLVRGARLTFNRMTEDASGQPVPELQSDVPGDSVMRSPLQQDDLFPRVAGEGPAED